MKTGMVIITPHSQGDCEDEMSQCVKKALRIVSGKVRCIQSMLALFIVATLLSTTVLPIYIPLSSAGESQAGGF